MDTLLKIGEVEAAVGMGRSTIYDELKRGGDFPRPVQVTSARRRAVRWKASDIAAWMDSRPTVEYDPDPEAGK